MARYVSGSLILSSGRSLPIVCDCLGLDLGDTKLSAKVTTGYDDELDLDSLSKAEQLELCQFMINQWLILKNKLVLDETDV